MRLTSPENKRWHEGRLKEALAKATSRESFFQRISFLELARRVADVTDTGEVDLRGLDLTPILGEQMRVDPGHHVALDFSKSEGTDVYFGQSSFVRCNFDRTRWHNIVIRDCSFNDCSFADSVWDSSALGIRCTFMRCDFSRMSGRGEYFSFGRQSRFVECNFLEIEAKRVDDHSVVFERCRFSGRLEAAKFRGKKYVWARRLGSMRNLLSGAYRPVKFCDCDLSKLTVPPDCFDPGVILSQRPL